MGDWYWKKHVECGRGNNANSRIQGSDGYWNIQVDTHRTGALPSIVHFHRNHQQHAPFKHYVHNQVWRMAATTILIVEGCMVARLFLGDLLLGDAALVEESAALVEESAVTAWCSLLGRFLQYLQLSWNVAYIYTARGGQREHYIFCAKIATTFVFIVNIWDNGQ